MEAASAIFPMRPPSASISRTRCPFAMPPMHGLQLICAMWSRFMVSIRVDAPSLAEAAQYLTASGP